MGFRFPTAPTKASVASTSHRNCQERATVPLPWLLRRDIRDHVQAVQHFLLFVFFFPFLLRPSLWKPIRRPSFDHSVQLQSFFLLSFFSRQFGRVVCRLSTANGSVIRGRPKGVSFSRLRVNTTESNSIPGLFFFFFFYISDYFYFGLFWFVLAIKRKKSWLLETGCSNPSHIRSEAAVGGQASGQVWRAVENSKLFT